MYVLSRNKENINFLSENFHFLVMKFSGYLNRRVFVMYSENKGTDQSIRTYLA